MNTHLKSVREFRDTYSLPHASCGMKAHLSDMDIVVHLGLLMEAASKMSYSLKKGEMAEILLYLAEIAYCALNAIAMLEEDVVERPIEWRHDGSVLSVMKLLTEKIHYCISGKTEDYSALYCACKHLSSSFLNADFDKAMQMLHCIHMDRCRGPNTNHYININANLLNPAPDLSECLYE